MNRLRKKLMGAILLSAFGLTATAGYSQGPVAAYNINSQGAMSQTTSGASSSVATGYSLIVRNAGSATPAGVAIYGSHTNGVLISEAGVPAVPLVQSGRIFAETGGAVTTGIAIANPNATDATISFYFTDAAGTNIGAGSTTVQANSQISKFLNEAPFNGSASMNGTFTFSSSLPVGVVALRGLVNERGEFLITTLPVAELTASTSAALVFPHFADGGGWSTKLVLVNSTDAPISGTVRFYGSGSGTTAATPVPVAINGQTNTAFSYSIAPRSSQAMATAGLQAGVQVGSIQVTPVPGSVAPVGLGIFSYQTGGITVTQSGVPGLPVGAAFRLFAESSAQAAGQSGWLETGVAVANPSTQPATVTFVLTSAAGATVASGAETIAANGKISKFIGEISGLGGLPHPFQGVLRVSTDSAAGISVLGLRGRYNERGQFLIATTSPTSEAAVQNGMLMFPHFADGGGYTTQFVLISTTGQASGVMTFMTPAGSPAPVSFGTTASVLNSVSVSPATVTGGSSATLTVTLSGPAPSGGATINLSSSSTALTVPATVTIPAGQSAASVQTQAANVSAATSATVTATYGGLNVATSVAVTGTGTLPQVSSVSISPASVSSGSSATVTVTLSGPAPSTGATVSLSSSNSSAFAVPATHTIASGQTVGVFQVQAGSVSAAASVTVTASYNSSSQNASVVVTAGVALPTLSAISISPVSVTSGSSATVTVTLTGPAPAGGATVSLSSSNNLAVQVPGTLTIPSGQTVGNFAAQAGTVVVTTSSTIGATYNNSSVSSALNVTAVGQ